jgi:hypothetical protein
VSRDDAPDDVETQPCTLADAFGGEERLEDTVFISREMLGPSLCEVFTFSLPCPFMACTALSTILVHTWLSSPPWAQMRGSPSAYSRSMYTPIYQQQRHGITPQLELPQSVHRRRCRIGPQDTAAVSIARVAVLPAQVALDRP